MIVELLPQGWRTALAEFLGGVREHLTVASPYIKTREAEWVCDRVAPSAAINLLTDVNSRSVEANVLDLAALRRFTSRPGTSVTNLPRLHAKVWVADASTAIVTSGNITKAGIDGNYEYGVLIRDPDAAAQIERDLRVCARLGSTLTDEAVARLEGVTDALRQGARQMEAHAPTEARRAFERLLREVEVEFVAKQVGTRSANAMFGEAILVALASGPLTTADLGKIVPELLPPELCDDTRELVINGDRFGKAWKHTLRNAQQQLKRQGIVEYSAAARIWRLAPGA